LLTAASGHRLTEFVFFRVFPADFVFGNQIFDRILLLPIDPARQNKKQYLPGVQNGFHAGLRMHVFGT
jgi:hypothetical protein